MNNKLTYQTLQKAIKTLGLIGLENKNDIKKRYLKLSKLYHPDTQNGNKIKFQEITQAYKIINQYIDEFKFSFTKNEFKDQYPFLSDNDKNGNDFLWASS